MTRHELKCWPEPFQATWDKIKTFEIRREDDRRFEFGDQIILREWNPATGLYTEREVFAEVVYVSRGAWGLPDGLVVLGLNILDFSHRRFPLPGKPLGAVQ